MDFEEFTGKTLEDAITNAKIALGLTGEDIEYEVIDDGRTGFLGIGSKPASIRARKKEENLNPEEYIRIFLNDMFKAMDLVVEIIINYDPIERFMDIELKGDEMGLLIGKRGVTLDSLQYIISLALNRKFPDYIKVRLDTEDYRKRRKETLESLAKNVSYKVKRTKRPVSLEAMNPYERRVIHSALQNDKFVTTHSEGEEPYRHVVVTLK